MKCYWGVLLKAAITFGLLYFLVSKVDLAKSVDLLVRTNIGAVTLALIVLAIQTGFAILRWHRILIKKEMHIPMKRSARYFWLGLFFNQVLPSSIGGDAVRGYCLVRDGQSVGRATLSVLLDRVLGMVGLVMLIALAMPYAMNLINVPEMQWGMVFALLAVISGLVSILFMDIFTKKFTDWRVMKSLTTLTSDARQLLASQQGLWLIVLSVLVHLLSIVVVGMLSWALAIRVDWTALAVIVPIATLLMTVPLSIAGWGVREGVMVVGLGYVGIAAEEALALSILYGLSMLMIALPGGLAWLTGPTVRSQNVNQELANEMKDTSR
jgi:uncharacterized protein (TIRG00374 family)